MRMKKEWRKKEKPQTRDSSMWQGLLDTWHSLLASSDYLSSLTPRQIAQMSPKRIEELGKKIAELPAEGLQMWNIEQIQALTIDQLCSLTSDQAKAIAERASSKTLSNWIQNGRGPRFFSELSTLIIRVQSSKEIMKKVIQSIKKIEDTEALSEIISSLLECGSDQFFIELFNVIEKKRVDSAIESSVHASLLDDSLFRQRYKQDMAKFVKARVDYETLDQVHKEAIEDVGKYERRFELATSLAVRRQIYREMTEWLHEVPVAGLSRFLTSPTALFSSSIGEQNRDLSHIVDHLRRQLRQSRRDLIQDRHVLWMPLSELEKEKKHVERLYGEVVIEVEKHIANLQVYSSSENPLMKKIQSGIPSARSLQKIDEFVVKIEEELVALEAIGKDLRLGLEEVKLLQRAVFNAMEKERLEVEGVGYMSAMPVQLYARLTQVNHPFRKKLEKHPDMHRFSEHMLLVGSLVDLSEKMQKDFTRLVLGKSGISEARKKVEVWKALKADTPWEEE